MIPSIRQHYNDQFTQEKFDQFVEDLNRPHPGSIVFRVAETPVFIPKDFTQKMIDACESIVDVITDANFKKVTNQAIPDGEKVPNENEYSDFIAFDFGICENESGALEPQLIEMQGFPTLFCYQNFLSNTFKNHFDIPANFSPFLGGYNEASYLAFLKEIILGGHSPEEVILLELKPHEQKTRIDFYCTTDAVGIPVICLTELDADGKNLFYEKDGKRVQIKRIYNRIIFDELMKIKNDLGNTIDITQEWNVEWVPHPNWFYRISKYTLPFIRHEYVPKTYFLNEVKQLPQDIENYVLKPLFSFAGQGVIIDIKPEDFENIKEPENWILQKKVKYASVIETPDEPAKAEIRIFYFWKKNSPRPVPVFNLARLSKENMIGVRYNSDKKWVGGTIAYFEQ